MPIYVVVLMILIRTGSVTADDPVDRLAWELTERYITQVGKIPTDQIRAATILVGASLRHDPALVRSLSKSLGQHCGNEGTLIIRRKILSVFRRAFESTGGAARWSDQSDSTRRQVELFALPDEDAVLAQIIRCGRTADRSDIDNYVLALRAAHHPATSDFLRDVLRHETKWKDHQGGSWGDAKFHAAVGLAELGDAAGWNWLIAAATPNEFGIDDTVYRGAHVSVTTGSLRANCKAALMDLAGLQVAPASWTDWWQTNGDQLQPQHVGLKQDY